MKPYVHTPGAVVVQPKKKWLPSNDEFAPCVICKGTYFKFVVGYGYVVKFCKKDGVGVVINQVQAEKYLKDQPAPQLRI